MKTIPSLSCGISHSSPLRRICRRFGSSMILGLLVVPSLAMALDNCSNETLVGSYAAHYRGFISHGSGPSQPGGGYIPVTGVIVVTFDGNGSISPSTGAALNVGTEEVFFDVTGGSYSVNPDCTGTLTFSTNLPRTFLHKIVLTSNGEEYRFLRLTPPGAPVGIIQSGTAQRM